MAPLNPKALEYTPICAAAYTPCPTSHSYAIHHLCPTSTISSHHYHLLPFANFFPPVTPYYYTQLHLAPPPLPAVPPPCTPPPVTAPSTSVTHKHFDAGPSRPSPSWTTGVIGFDHRRNSESVTRPGCQMFRKRLGKHQVIHLRCFPKKTSVMIKNIPYNYTREMVLEFLDEHCAVENKKGKNDVVSAYDFLYLPMDFKKQKSKGYAFVNFTNYRAVWRFFHAFHNKTSVFLESTKTVMVVSANIQGKEAQVKRFESTIFNCESKAFLPVWFSPARDGSRRAVKHMTVGKCGRTSTTSDPSSFGN